MPVYSLLFAATPEEAIATALEDYKWLQHEPALRYEFRRHDSNERIRFVPDGPASETLQNQQYGTRVYIGRGCARRKDVKGIVDAVVNGQFILVTLEEARYQPPSRRRGESMSDQDRARIRAMWYR